MYTRFIKEGDQVRIVRGENIYESSVDSVIDDRNIKILLPWCRQRILLLRDDEEFAMSCLGDRGAILCTVQVKKRTFEDNVGMIELELLENPGRVQRRESYRVNVTTDVYLKWPDNVKKAPIPQQKNHAFLKTRAAKPKSFPGWTLTNTIDVSHTGMQFVLDQPLEQGDVLLCRMNLDRFGMGAFLDDLKIEVMRCLEPDYKTDKYRIGARFMNISDREADTVLRFVTLVQRKSLEQRTVE